MKSNTALYQKIILPIIKKHLPKASIILYGSRARNEDKEGADIDIALKAEEKIDRAVLSSLISDIEESPLPIKFDIVDFFAVSSEMQKAIMKDGVIWQ